ncbi:SDR family oxidoreductase [Methylomonas sp. HW2-6]|uniref:SDR family oxidoreductase n=1 Tax=Methylomonas sp. HW2-6 TaxID=3376687 RepID=UPI0040427C13
MNILLTGATGFIGRAIALALLEQGHRVTACCRRPQRLRLESPLLTPLALDFAEADQIENWLPHLQGIDAIVNCVGIIAPGPRQSFQQLHSQSPIALFRAGAMAGVRKIVQLSALGVDDQAASAYHLSKKAADDALSELPLDWFVLQPSLVYGPGGRSHALFQALAALPVHLLPEGGKQVLQPIHVDDVAAAVCRCLQPGCGGRRTIALVGSEPISYADWLQGLRLRLGKSRAGAWLLPQRYAAIGAGFGRALAEPILSRDNLAMLQRGSTADPAPLIELLGRSPLSAKRMFADDASQAERWHANLYFLRPLLGWSIALVWLWSGITSLFFYPHQASYALLAATGISGIAAPLTLYGLAALDIAMGLMTLARIRLPALLLCQFYIVLGYSLMVAWRLPEFVFHPFGPLLKNLPFLMCLLVYRILDGERP